MAEARTARAGLSGPIERLPRIDAETVTAYVAIDRTAGSAGPAFIGFIPAPPGSMPCGTRFAG